MNLYFLSSNKHKVEEFRKFLSPEIEFKQLKLDLAEVQSLNPTNVITHKLNEARKIHKGELIVEDSSLCLDALNGFPGPLIKYFYEAIGKEGILKIVEKFNCNTAQAKTMIGYFNGKKIVFFEGITKGKIVPIKVDNDFGFDAIFAPKNQDKTYSEMTKEEKNKVSHRGKALKKFKEYYLNKKIKDFA
ncbi:MAG: RdgB/HAM1 family non-canonical purine NTP pyrophosphatase [Candidatus ainarchaeum sp.]|nr:RdgB/HAM1 family non-canonical purine NTP pyrophosphatase [Candidatus ainarchaeum sp.]